MHDGAFAQALRFATRGLQLFQRQGRRAAVPDARRREDLDDIGALVDEAAHTCADRIRVAALNRP
jgi:hypothetical protein